jgi:hypothetical protein
MSRHDLAPLFAVVAALVALAACQQRADSVKAAPAGSAATTRPASAASTAVCEAQQALDQMDARSAVPLVPMMANHQRQSMRDHLLAVQEIVVAASTDDFTAIEQAAGRIGFSEQMGAMCTHMGAGAPGFTERALDFHRTADTIAAAARAHDRDAVMRALGATLQTCTGCHATFRQSVVDEATWNRLASTSAREIVPHGHDHTEK